MAELMGEPMSGLIELRRRLIELRRRLIELSVAD